MGRYAYGVYEMAVSGELQSVSAILGAPSTPTLDHLFAIQDVLLHLEQTPIRTEHLIHAGMYARTIRMDAGTVMIGSLISKATVLIINGSCTVLAGDDRLELEGYNVLPGVSGRKQLFVTRGPVEMTMILPTQAKSIKNAEDEVFAESDMLMSRRDGSSDIATITGF